MEVKIESNVLIPENTNQTHGGKWIDVFRLMKIGDSFIVESDKINIVRMSAIKYKERKDENFFYVTKKVLENGKFVHRFWRVTQPSSTE